jgi:hypothetical protein
MKGTDGKSAGLDVHKATGFVALNQKGFSVVFK